MYESFWSMLFVCQLLCESFWSVLFVCPLLSERFFGAGSSFVRYCVYNKGEYRHALSPRNPTLLLIKMVLPPNLHSVPDAQHVPDNALLLYNLKGGIYYIERTHIHQFAWLYTQQTHEALHLTLDLAFARIHALVFDLDFSGPFTSQHVHDYADQVLIPELQQMLPPDLKLYTLLLATRPGGGLHAHLPELRIAHDDYILLCTRLQSRLARSTAQYTVRLDVVVNFSLPTASKPGTPPYTPFRVVYVDTAHTLTLPLHDRPSFDACKHIVRKQFKPKKANQSTLFGQLLQYDYPHYVQHLLVAMMPYIDAARTTVGYRTAIDTRHPEYEELAHFVVRRYTMTVAAQSIFKALQLSLLTEAPSSFAYLARNATHLHDFQTENRALRVWYERYHHLPHLRQDDFLPINQCLIDDNAYFRDQAHPLTAVLQYNHGYYFLPVFYALLNHLHFSPSDLIRRLRPLLPDAGGLLDRLEAVPVGVLTEMARGFTLDTILYCGSNLWPKINHFEANVGRILEDMSSEFVACQSVEDILELVKRIQRRFVPHQMITLRGSSKKSYRILWNLQLEQWQEMQSSSNLEIANFVNMLFHQINRFARLHDLDKNLQLQSKHVNEIVACIACLTSMDVKLVHMNKHKWHLKTDAGVLDLFTGHVGGTVPEFYLCERTMGLSLSREVLMALPEDASLWALFRTLVSRRFFRAYLERILTPGGPNDFFDGLVQLVEERGHPTTEGLARSMLHVYVHLCKYVSFEFEEFEFLLNVLASLLIATNYGKCFFILQGLVGNGKSKFFELVNRTFGQLAKGINRVNLQPGHGISAQPEMATTLFSCRVITIEELAGKIDENLIKEVSGNCNTSFRNMYEASVGGIPTAKIMAATNYPPNCTATEAFRQRIIVFPFQAKFLPQVPPSVAKQVIENVYELKESDSVVSESYQGLFVMLYYYLREHMAPDTGYVPYREQPPIMREFKDRYLMITDLYVKFKQHADVQVVPNEMVTRSDVLSAVRQFLVYTKQVQVRDQDLLARFEQEFAEYRQTDDQPFAFSALDPLEPPAPKREAQSIVYYQHVVIKNMKKTQKH